MSRECTEQQFLKDVAGHRLYIQHSDGIYRHLRFRAENHGWNMWFEIVTWPGKLTLSGDMGTWTFSRLSDMFDFFRSSTELKINPSYWAEKLEGGNISGSRTGAMQFDSEVFTKQLFERIKSYDLTAKQRGFVGRELKASLHSDNEYELYREAYDFTCEVPGYGKFEFDGADLPDGIVYTYRFLWCLYAIVWGIHKFDNGDVRQ